MQRYRIIPERRGLREIRNSRQQKRRVFDVRRRSLAILPSILNGAHLFRLVECADLIFAIRHLRTFAKYKILKAFPSAKLDLFGSRGDIIMANHHIYMQELFRELPALFQSLGIEKNGIGNLLKLPGTQALATLEESPLTPVDILNHIRTR